MHCSSSPCSSTPAFPAHLLFFESTGHTPPQHRVLSLLPGMLFPQTATCSLTTSCGSLLKPCLREASVRHSILLETATLLPTFPALLTGLPSFTASALTTSCHALDWNRAVRQNMDTQINLNFSSFIGCRASAEM